MSWGVADAYSAEQHLRRRHAVQRHGAAQLPALPADRRGSATINPLVLECNDGYLNDIQAMAVREEHVFSALDNHSTRFARGSVGRGMSSFGLKGGIGTASRYCPGLGTMLGVLVLANFGTLDSLTLSGVRVGPALGKLLAIRRRRWTPARSLSSSPAIGRWTVAS